MSLSLEVIENPDRLQDYRDSWSSLLERSSTNHPTLLPSWLSAWWSVFGASSGRVMKVGLFFAEDRLVGLAPLLARRYWYRPGLPFRRLEFLGSGESEADEICSDYLSIIAEDGFESAVARAFARAVVLGEFGPHDEVVLSVMDSSTLLPVLLEREFRERGFDAHLWESALCPYIPLPDSWDAYLAALPGSRRYFIRKSLRDLERFSGGKYRVERVERPADLPRGIQILRRLHDDRWSAERPRGAFGSPTFSRFHEIMLPELLESGSLDLCWLQVHDEPVAVLYNIVHNGRCYFYQSGRSLLLPKGIRPGIVLHAHAIRNAIDAGLREYDFLAGASRYKLELSLATRPLVTLRAARPSLVEAARRLSRTGLERARAWRRQNGGPQDVHEAPAQPADGYLQPAG
jgi:CelD/BcsL family acetyltransferase involved in cellulose biosynthesis